MEEVVNFRGFWVFNFGTYTELENSKSSEIFSTFVIVCLEEVLNFRGCRVFDFVPYTALENADIFSRLVIVLLEEVENSQGFGVFGFGPYTEIERSGNSKIFPRLVKLSKFVLFKKVINLWGHSCALKDFCSIK